MSLQDDWKDVTPKGHKRRRPKKGPHANRTEEEWQFWDRLVIAYVKSGRPLGNGNHLRCADRAVEARRRRVPHDDAVFADLISVGVERLERFSSDLPVSKQDYKLTVRMAIKAMEMHKGKKISQIKELRAQAGFGLKEAKTVIETLRDLVPGS